MASWFPNSMSEWVLDYALLYIHKLSLLSNICIEISPIYKTSSGWNDKITGFLVQLLNLTQNENHYLLFSPLFVSLIASNKYVFRGGVANKNETKPWSYIYRINITNITDINIIYSNPYCHCLLQTRPYQSVLPGPKEHHQVWWLACSHAPCWALQMASHGSSPNCWWWVCLWWGKQILKYYLQVTRLLIGNKANLVTSMGDDDFFKSLLCMLFIISGFPTFFKASRK